MARVITHRPSATHAVRALMQANPRRCFTLLELDALLGREWSLAVISAVVGRLAQRGCVVRDYRPNERHGRRGVRRRVCMYQWRVG